jgi:succinate dehydrogenase / fumarate reductase, cytochrome b subunit
MSTQATAEAITDRTPILKSRLGSFLAVVPLSIWVINHLWDNLSAFYGAAAWEKSVTEYANPFAQAFTFIIVMLPLLIHAAWGVVRMFSFKPNNLAYNNYGNIKYLVQRIAAVGVLAFLGAHIWLAFLHPRLVEGHAEPFSDIAREMHYHGPTLMVYLLGTLGTAFHLANGLQTFAMGWGIFASDRSMRRFEPFSILIFLVLLAMAWGSIYALYTAGAAFSPEGLDVG